MDAPCTLLIQYDTSEPPNLTELKHQLEHGDENEKIQALKRVVTLQLNGEKLPNLLMTLIRFVLPSKNHTIKKLLLLYWEAINKHGPDGKLLSEMILVCNALRNDLIHPNEYVRGSTLRYLCKLKEPELLEPLMPSVINNLEHRHSYVRRNAVLALFSIYKDFEQLCPDAPELVYNFLLNEGDATCKRNAFIMLYNCAQQRALDYLNTVIDQVSSFGDILQFVTIELLRKVSRTNLNPGERSRYLRCIGSLLSSSSPAVQYEAAAALYALSSTPTAIKAAASTFISLLCSQSDNNVKLIILDKLQEIKKKHNKVMQDLLMDVLRALSSPTLDIRQKTLDFAMDLVNPRNIDEVVLLLKKEVNRTQSAEMDKAAEYRQILIKTIHSCAVKFPNVASSVVHVLMDFLGDSNVASAVDVIVFVREVVETYPDLRASIVSKLVESLDQIKASQVYRAALWIISEYSSSVNEIDVAFTAIKDALGTLPFATDSDEETESSENKSTTPVSSSGPNRILPDGTYATQSAYVESNSSPALKSAPSLRTLLIGGDFFLAGTVAIALTKLALHLRQLGDVPPVVRNSVTAEVLLILTSIVRLGQSKTATIDPDSHERIILCINVLLLPGTSLPARLLLDDCHRSFTEMLQEQKNARPAEVESKEVAVQADDLITFRQLVARSPGVAAGEEDDAEADLHRATGANEQTRDGSSKLNRITQLTGFSDPLYAEAYVNVHRYDIVLDVLVINRTNDTLQNVCLELATLGDLKLCERPQNYTIGPKGKRWIKASIKVSSTETGVIFGNLVYDIAGSSASDKNCVVLNDIHVDIMDYITPATTSEVLYRIMWAEFEWENKVAINSSISDLLEFLNHIVKSTNMRCLTPKSSLQGDCGFLAANLYAKSIFGEDALANVSVEKVDGRITGYIRIRSKTQGVALSLGDKITLKQSCKSE